MRHLTLALILVACGGEAPTEPIDTGPAHINVSGVYHAAHIGGESLPIQLEDRCAIDVRPEPMPPFTVARSVVLVSIKFMDNEPSPEMPDGVLAVTRTEGRWGVCPEEVEVTGTYTAREDSVFFTWDQPDFVRPPSYDAAWDGVRWTAEGVYGLTEFVRE